MDPFLPPSQNTRTRLINMACIVGIAVLIGLAVFWKPVVGFSLLVLYFVLLFLDMKFFKKHLAAVYNNEYLPVSVIAAMPPEMRYAYMEHRRNRSHWILTEGSDLINKTLELPLGSVRLALRAKLRGEQWPPQYHPPFVYQDESTGTQITVE